MVGESEAVCSACHLVYWRPAGTDTNCRDCGTGAFQPAA